MEFVVGASEATMKSLLGKLGSLLAQEYTLIRGVRRDVQYINDELTTMQAFLGDVSSAPDGHDRRLKDWMKQIRDMAYDMEDCIDDFAHRLPHDSLSDATCSFIVMRVYELWTFGPRREIASKIADLKLRAQQIAERRGRYGVDNPGNSNSSTSVAGASRAARHEHDITEHLMGSRQLIRTEKPVGVGAYMRELGNWLNKRDNISGKHRAVLSIVGFGGMGKTTIATALYRNFRNEFDCRASVTVSQNYDEDEVLRDILGQIKPQDSEHEQQGSSKGGLEKKRLSADIKSSVKRVFPLIFGHRQQGNDGSSNWMQNKIETMNRDQLVKELEGRLNGKRYLLLIDDIWSAETWDKIRNWLPHDNTKDSRVIVTTRFQAVGAACSEGEGTDHLHTVDVLNDVDSKSLFNHSVYESESSEKEQVHEDIWKYCGGLPLAIVAVAGLVACNRRKKSDHWSKVCESLFTEQGAPLTLDGVTRILDYCYDDLSAELKTCLLYLSIFPKGSKISRKRLTRRWISECFVSGKQGLTEDEVAETYFNQLIERKIIRPLEHSSNGKVKSFKVHDMILEYIVSKSSEENFITVVGGHWQMPAPSNKVRRLSMQSSGSKHGNSTKGMNLSQVRSLTVFGSMNKLPFHSFNNGIIQVLDLEGWKGLTHNHLNDICRMLVLKYLSLRRTEVAKIPSKIEKLQYLETLDIRETNVVVLPKAFGQLQRLRSMLGGSKNPRKALRLPQEKNKEQMKALRILSGIEITEGSTAVASLHQLTGLRKLAIYKLNVQKGGRTSTQLRSSIEYLCSCGLQTLAINDEGSDFISSLDAMSAPPRYLIALELSGKMKRAPKWINNLKNLFKLTLSVTVLRADTLELLGDLPKLFSLTFSLSAAKQDQADIEDMLQENKRLGDGEIVVPPGGFANLKLLRFFATIVPRLTFTAKAMPALERIDMRFQAFEGIYGVDTLESIQEVHLSVDSQADEATKFLVGYLKDNTKRTKIITN
ncbi:disease resistance protein RPP13 [Brachypodium distachyon]|uniref:AAA+ ATPase domain-containing protein n=1 Tax=Brachypodium distachyon TaxID=15368 RepID=I1GKQ6_BRADI|nr:disease resistance protein RPP13 [Brachypodium distachyon]KQK12047.1 hypothetical protein BRADI_1g01250v3 [Brachypodium distachyon]|eukprot:XP_010231932.1 disease resistance protein RPP13 [Brachypodium distachyon]